MPIMKTLGKRLLANTPAYDLVRLRIYRPYKEWRSRRREAQQVKEWEAAGKPAPPPHVIKQRALREYGSRFGLRILVETGTQYGAMVYAMRHSFDRIYSIELSDMLYERAAKRFRDFPHIEIVHGDSAREIQKVLRRLDGPTLFWLDGHYSGGLTARGERHTPILEELQHILSVNDTRYVILIDDARKFGTHPEYPTIEEVVHFVSARQPNLAVAVEDDIIRITPV